MLVVASSWAGLKIMVQFPAGTRYNISCPICASQFLGTASLLFSQYWDNVARA